MAPHLAAGAVGVQIDIAALDAYSGGWQPIAM